MIDYIESKSSTGTPIRIEVEPTTKGVGFGRQQRDPDADSEQSLDVYAQMLATIRACATDLVNTIEDLETPPTTATVNFALKVDGSAGALIAKSADSAQFKISLTWKQEGPDNNEGDS